MGILITPIYRLPLHKTVFTRRDRPRLSHPLIAHHTKSVINKERRNLLHIVTQLCISFRHVRILTRGRFELDHHQRQSIDKYDHIRTPYRVPIDRPLISDRKPIM